MLRASVVHVGGEVDLRSIASGPEVDSGLPHSTELLALADAAVRELAQLERAREALRAAAGTAALNDAAAVIANFEMMTRVADTTGAAIDPANKERLGPILATTGAGSLETMRWG